MAVKLAPIPLQYFDSNGDPLSGGLLNFYAAGSTTRQTTFTDSTGAVPGSNPVVLDSAGRIPTGGVWLTEGLAYKMVPTDSSAVAAGAPLDGIRGVNDASISVDEWVASGFTPTYIGATSFSVPGDQTSTLHLGRRIQASVSGGTRYGSISGTSFGAGITTVTVALDSGSLDSGLSAVSYGLLSATNSSEPERIEAFAPTLQGSTTPGTQTYSKQIGRGRKSGHLFFFTNRISLSAKDGTTAGNLRIGGFPYSGSSNADAMSPITVGYWKFNLDAGFTQVVAQWEPADGRVYLAQCGDNVDKQYLTEANLLDDSVIHLSGFYETA